MRSPAEELKEKGVSFTPPAQKELQTMLDAVGEIVDLGVKLEIIDKAGAWFTVGEQRIQGRDAVKEYLLCNPEVCANIEQQIRDNAYKLMSPQARKAAQAAGRAVDVSADDFEG